ncbi:MAG: RDD family protein [Fulvivirga sp.]|uniref:RDD family protein n=1 Tax=Fulvivirga sp. TaxID=1931237 RepID=UPI0032EFE295
MAIYVNTHQNVQINYENSSIADRLIAYLIDALVIAGISLSILFIGSIIDLGYATFFMFVPIFFYHLICEIFMNGQSVGKRYRGIRVMKKDGNAAGLSAYFLRFLLRPIDTFYGIGLAVIFFTSKNQRLGDLAAGTIVVNVKSEAKLKSEILSEMSVNEDHVIMYPEVSELSDREVQLISEILDNRADAKNHPNISQLALKLELKLGVKIKDNQTDYIFLQQVVRDYYKMHTDQV